MGSNPSQQFLKLYNRLDRHLRGLLHKGPEVPHSALLSLAMSKDRVVA